MVIDARPRCWWPIGTVPGDALMAEYHDTEWGVPVADDTALFERLALEGFQAGLSWSTILRKRQAFRAAFAGFEPAAVAAFGQDDRERLLLDAGIVRNRAKIDATIGNAAAFLAVVDECGTFGAYLAAMLPRPAPTLPPDSTMQHVPATTPESDALSADLRRRGFRFVGSTIMYAFMQSVGLVDDHIAGCWRYRGEAARSQRDGGASGEGREPELAVVRRAAGSAGEHQADRDDHQYGPDHGPERAPTHGAPADQADPLPDPDEPHDEEHRDDDEPRESHD